MSAALLLLVALGTLAAVAAISTVIVTLRDGYRRVPTRTPLSRTA